MISKQPSEQDFKRYSDEIMRYQKLSKASQPSKPPPNVQKPPPSILPPMAIEPPPTKPQNQTTNIQEATYDDFIKANDKKGFLKVQTYSARRAYPVSDATVIITKLFTNGRHEIGRYKTDANGETPIITLPAKSKEDSEQPGSEKPFYTYDVNVTHDEYLDMNYYDVPVFENIVSIQAVDLIPKGAAPENVNSYDVVENEPKDL